MDELSFQRFLRDRRQELGFTLKKASKATGVAASRLHDLERGISSTTNKPTVPTRENIRRIARGFKIPEDFLLGLAGNPKLGPAATDEERLVTHFRHLQQGHKLAVLQLVDQLFQMDQAT